MAFALVQISRLGLWFVGRQALNDTSSARWLTLLRGGALLSGTAWGMLSALPFPADFPHQMLLAFISAGVTGAAVAAPSIDRVSAWIFVVTAL